MLIEAMMTDPCQTSRGFVGPIRKARRPSSGSRCSGLGQPPRRAFLSPMTHKERELLDTIGRQVTGPRHMANVDAVPEVVALIE